jgi:hypothetical protein
MDRIAIPEEPDWIDDPDMPTVPARTAAGQTLASPAKIVRPQITLPDEPDFLEG